MQWAEGPVRVRVPATSANLGPGFDTLGLALSLHDEIEARVTRAGLDIDVTGEGAADTAHAGEKHLVVRAMRVAFDDLNIAQPPGLALRCVNRIPHGRGLGSSAAAIVAGLMAARALAGAPVGPQDVLPLASFLEGHPDNVAPCLFGGLTIAWVADEAPIAGQLPQPPDTYSAPQAPSRGLAPGEGLWGRDDPPMFGGVTGEADQQRQPPDTYSAPQAPSRGGAPARGLWGRDFPMFGGVTGGTAPGGDTAGTAPGGDRAAPRGGTARAVRLDPRPEVRPVAFIAPEPVSTKVARGLLPTTVPHHDAARNAGRAALLIAALTARPDVLLDGTEDRLHQDYRATAMPHSHDLLTRLRRSGVPAVVSGAGPSVLAFLVENPSQDDLKRLDSIAAETGIDWHISPLPVEEQGASVTPGGQNAR